MYNLLTREASFTRASEDSDGDVTISLAMASEIPYQRWFGIEILSVNDAAVRMDRLNDGAPVLYNHNWDELRGVHVPGTLSTKGNVLRGDVRLQSATQEGRDTIALVKSGVLLKSSVGYRIHKVIEKTKTKDGQELQREIPGEVFERLLNDLPNRGEASPQHFTRALDAAVGQVARAADDLPTYLVVDWEPYENSLVTVPADPSVGVGRSASLPIPSPSTPALSATRSANMEPKQPNEGGAPARVEGGEPPQPSAVEMNAQRTRAIDNLCKANNIDEGIRNLWVSSGASVEKVSDELLRIMEERGRASQSSIARLDLSDKDLKKFSITRAIRACADQNWADAGFEAECSSEIAKRMQRVPDKKKFFVPYDVLHREIDGRAIQGGQRAFRGGDMRNVNPYFQRDVTVASASGGGYLVATSNQSFIDLLRNRSVAFRMGARPLTGLVGNVNIPKQTGAATAYWLSSESTQITESQQTFGQLAFAPKTVGGYTEISRLLLLQSSPDIEGIVNADLAAIIALAVDTGVISGSGSSGQPTGILNTSGIGTATGMSSLAYAGVLSFQTTVATANVVPAAGGYVTTPSVAALLMQRTKFSNTATPLWDGNLWDGSIAGFPGMSSNQMASASMLFGDWSQVVVAEWGVLEIEVNPYANFQAGIIGVRAMMTCDVGLRYPAAFTSGTSIT